MPRDRETDAAERRPPAARSRPGEARASSTSWIESDRHVDELIASFARLLDAPPTRGDEGRNGGEATVITLRSATTGPDSLSLRGQLLRRRGA